jgi:hypothetical protein
MDFKDFTIKNGAYDDLIPLTDEKCELYGYIKAMKDSRKVLRDYSDKCEDAMKYVLDELVMRQKVKLIDAEIKNLVEGGFNVNVSVEATHKSKFFKRKFTLYIEKSFSIKKIQTLVSAELMHIDADWDAWENVDIYITYLSFHDAKD